MKTPEPRLKKECRWSRTTQPGSGIFISLIALFVFTIGCGANEFPTVGHPSFLSPHSRPIAILGQRVFVANTAADTVDVIDARSRKVVARIDVGIDPVSVAVRPDGREIWVANHVSDSVSVIDSDSASPTFLRVVATVQDLDRKTRATRFDEPVGIAFAGNDKAYVALSSENEIAVVNVAARRVEKRLAITAQDPRAIVVRGNRLYVLPFESNNKTQLSGGYKIDGDLVTFNAHEHSIANNNVLSIGHVTDIVKHPRVPDRDLYVFDTRTDKLVEVVDTLGTLLYGLAVDSRGRAFIAQTDARNDANGRAGSKKHGLAELGNRAFLNRITKVDFSGERPRKPKFFDLEPLPPDHPAPGRALATPFAIQVSDDDSTLFVTASGSDKLFTVNAETGAILGRAAVGSVPRGIALESGADGRPSRAWVLNAVANSVSLVDVSNPASLKVTATVALDDPTHPAFKRGRIAFNKAAASSSGTFSCASCHPDGHTDQLLWVLKTPIVTGGNQIMPRSTMPIRGLRDTAPFHWDGIPGDPYGGINSASLRKGVEPNCDVNVAESAPRHLIDGGLASTMLRDGDTVKNDEGKAGLLSAAERDDLAKFILNVTYPPAQRRAYDNELSDRARAGFELFHIKGNLEGKPKPNVCGDCHRMPFWVSSNTPGSGMDAPTWRGAYDRFLILPQGRLNIIDFDFYRRIAEEGIPERKMWRLSWRSNARFDPIWDMVLEGSTGHSGSFARQLTVNRETAGDELTADVLSALETSAREGGIVLRVEGAMLAGKKATPIRLQFHAGNGKGRYATNAGDGKSYSREELVGLASDGRFIGTFTGRHGARADIDHPQPALWTLGPIHRQRGSQKFPELHEANRTMTVSGRHFGEEARLVVDGRRVEGTVKLAANERVDITLSKLPARGMHLLQVQEPDGLFSNDFIFHVTGGEADGRRLQNALEAAIACGDLAEAKRLLASGAKANALPEEGGSPLSTAAYHGRREIIDALFDAGANLSFANRDGNTPLHVAAFAGRVEIVRLFLRNGAPVGRRNGNRQTAEDIVSSEWNEEAARFYTAVGEATGMKFDLDQIEKMRPQISRMLREQKRRTQ
jgi:YVTN family beta-propeller protein